MKKAKEWVLVRLGVICLGAALVALMGAGIEIRWSKEPWWTTFTTICFFVGYVNILVFIARIIKPELGKNPGKSTGV